jgi:hypothetical protein
MTLITQQKTIIWATVAAALISAALLAATESGVQPRTAVDADAIRAGLAALCELSATGSAGHSDRSPACGAKHRPSGPDARSR